MEQKILNVGVISCSGMAQSHMLAVKAHERARLAAICDVDEEKLRQAGEKLEVDARYTDYRELLRHPGLDAVIIVTPDQLHREMVEAALDAAKTALAAEQEARKQAEDEALELLERVPAEEAPEDDTEPEAETPETEPDSELAAYRRAALTEQNAAARARRLQAHVSALCDNARSRYQDTGEEISALSADLTTGIERLQDALAELQLIFDQSEEAFEALELPDEDA